MLMSSHSKGRNRRRAWSFTDCRVVPLNVAATRCRGKRQRLSAFQEVNEARQKPFRAFRLAFPDRKDFPTQAAQPSSVLCIPPSICFQFVHPEVRSRGRRGTAARAIVSMPEAAVDKNNFAEAGKNQVRAPGKVGNVKSVPKPE